MALEPSGRVMPTLERARVLLGDMENTATSVSSEGLSSAVFI